MGAPVSQVAQSTQPQGKGGFQPPQPNQQGAPVDMTAPAGGQNGRPEPYPAQTRQVAQGLGKGSPNQSAPFAQGGNVTYPGQGGQPQMGRPNTYSNTVGPWDNASIKPQIQSGKGKGY